MRSPLPSWRSDRGVDRHGRNSENVSLTTTAATAVVDSLVFIAVSLATLLFIVYMHACTKR